MAPTFPHKHIKKKKKSTCRTSHPEHLLNIGRRSQTSKKGGNPLQNWVEKKEKKKKKRKKEVGWDQDP